MFPHLCGLKNTRIAEMKQIVLTICVDLEMELAKTEPTEKRIALIEEARTKAETALKEKGYNPYE